MCHPEAVTRLIAEIDTYLARRDGPGIKDVRDGIARSAGEAARRTAKAAPPSCGHLDEALLAMAGADALRGAIEDIRPQLGWVTYDAYPRAKIGERFPRAHAFVTLIGGAGFIPAEDFALGLFLIAPGTLYRDHFHPAPELYVPLTGPHEWRFGAGESWREYPAHAAIWNEPMQVHATLVRRQPFLALYAWTKDVEGVSVVAAAPDWAEIEARL
ncbi:dimethylsulfonioproprionate lyase family protein [Taklimakanibacter lacteus]|uniref:dimethylsulfonioproprionate lyase family protein n=1 Tax=Taklimakanibacter lacteus TaxID=2268456 RepID=UPI000E66B5F4